MVCEHSETRCSSSPSGSGTTRSFTTPTWPRAWGTPTWVSLPQPGWASRTCTQRSFVTSTLSSSHASAGPRTTLSSSGATCSRSLPESGKGEPWWIPNQWRKFSTKCTKMSSANLSQKLTIRVSLMTNLKSELFKFYSSFKRIKLVSQAETSFFSISIVIELPNLQPSVQERLAINFWHGSPILSVGTCLTDLRIACWVNL